MSLLFQALLGIVAAALGGSLAIHVNGASTVGWAESSKPNITYSSGLERGCWALQPNLWTGHIRQFTGILLRERCRVVGQKEHCITVALASESEDVGLRGLSPTYVLWTHEYIRIDGPAPMPTTSVEIIAGERRGWAAGRLKRDEERRKFRTWLEASRIGLTAFQSDCANGWFLGDGPSTYLM